MPDARKLAAEFIGTAVLVIIAVGVATESFGFQLFGSTFSAIGPISGCHVNPAVTFGFMATGRMKVQEGIAYIVAQTAGAIAGALVLWAIFDQIPGYGRSKQGMGTDGYGKYSHVLLGQGGAFLVEVVLTFIFVMVVLFATHKAAIQGAAGVAIGMTLVVVHLIGIPLTGTSVNPARSFGPALIVGGTALSQVWLFIAAPLVGGLVAAAAYTAIHGREKQAVGTPA
jgi:aquaporin Z